MIKRLSQEHNVTNVRKLYCRWEIFLVIFDVSNIWEILYNLMEFIVSQDSHETVEGTVKIIATK